MVSRRHSSSPVGGVVRRDEATVRHEPRAAVDAVDDPPAGHERPAGVGIAVLVVGHAGLPDQRAGAAVERRDERVARAHEQLVAVDGQIAAVRAAQRRGQRPAVLPEQRAGGGVERLHHVARVGEIQHAVMDERRRLVAPVAHRPDPGELQPADVLARDLVQRAVAPPVVRSPVDQPVVRVGVAQHRVGDRGARGNGTDCARAVLRAGVRRRGAGRPAGGAPPPEAAGATPFACRR